MDRLLCGAGCGAAGPGPGPGLWRCGQCGHTEPGPPLVARLEDWWEELGELGRSDRAGLLDLLHRTRHNLPPTHHLALEIKRRLVELNGGEPATLLAWCTDLMAVQPTVSPGLSEYRVG